MEVQTMSAKNAASVGSTGTEKQPQQRGRASTQSLIGPAVQSDSSYPEIRLGSLDPSSEEYRVRETVALRVARSRQSLIDAFVENDMAQARRIDPEIRRPQ